jgi:hypothetical protein
VRLSRALRTVSNPDHSRAGRARPYVYASPALGVNARFCRIEFVILAVTPIAGRGAEGDRRDLGQDDLAAIGSWIHISARPQAWLRVPGDGDCGRGQPGVPGVNIAYLDPDHHRVPGKAGRVPGDPGIVWGRTPGRWPGPARRGRTGGCGPGRWAARGSGCSARPCGYFSSTLSDTAGQRECAQSRRSARRFGQAGWPPIPRLNGSSACSTATELDQRGWSARGWRASGAALPGAGHRAGSFSSPGRMAGGIRGRCA